MKTILWVIIGAALVFVWLRWFERSSIFFPSRDVYADPAAAGLLYEQVYLNTADGKKVHGWFVTRQGAKKTVLFFHGNAGNITHRVDKIAFFNALGFNVFIIDYRGYGKSSGVPGEKGFYLDGEAAYAFLVGEKKIPPGDIIVYGESIGSAVALDVASKEEVGGVITEGAFTSVPDMAKVVYPFIPSAFLSMKFDSASKIKGISCPVLIIHSPDDEIVPFRMGEELYAAAPGKKTFLRVHGGHNDAFFESTREFERGITDFTGN